LAADDEPYVTPESVSDKQKQPSALALFEEISSAVIGNKVYNDTTKSIAAALAAGAVLGIMESMSEKKSQNKRAE